MWLILPASPPLFILVLRAPMNSFLFQTIIRGGGVCSGDLSLCLVFNVNQSYGYFHFNTLIDSDLLHKLFALAPSRGFQIYSEMPSVPHSLSLKGIVLKKKANCLLRQQMIPIVCIVLVNFTLMKV